MAGQLAMGLGPALWSLNPRCLPRLFVSSLGTLDHSKQDDRAVGE